MNFGFGLPYFLILLLLLPCFLWCKQYSKLFYFPKLDWIKKESPFFTWDPWLKIAIFSLMVFALAKPYTYDPASSNNKQGRDLVLAIDASGSMTQSGFDLNDRFVNKYETNLKLARDFIRKRFDDNMGAVVFGTFAFTTSPLTYDLEALSHLLNMTDVGVAGESTAIGDALIQSIRTLSNGKAQNKVIILLTDGYHNAGTTSPKDAVKKAKKEGIKVYTIGIGDNGDYDKALLENIAKESGGKSYSAASAKELKKIYKEIDSLEPSPIRSENFLNRHQLYVYPLGIAFALLFAWLIAQRRGIL